MSYIASPINYYRVNANNTSIATSSSGASAAPTEEITAPVSATGTVLSVVGTAVTGSGTNFTSAFDQGQYLYYIDGSGNYNLIGQIGVIVSNTSITLTAAAVNTPTSGLVLAAAYSLITSNESIYIRIPTAVGVTNTMDIPNFSSWRVGGGLNDTTISQLQQMSTAGTPLSNQTPPTNIPFTFVTMNIFPASGQVNGVTTYWRTSTDFPTFIWIKVTPQIGSSTNLASQTLFRFTTNENQPSIVISPSTVQTFLSAAGYAFASTGGNNTPNIN
jgi:hypothetical protein